MSSGVETVHPEYVARVTEWQMLRDVIAGSRAVWRRQRIKRRAKMLAAELRRKPIEIRPGGNEYQPDHAKYAGMEDTPAVRPAGPIAKYVPQNTHRVGSIAWSFFYRYIVPGA